MKSLSYGGESSKYSVPLELAAAGVLVNPSAWSSGFIERIAESLLRETSPCALSQAQSLSLSSLDESKREETDHSSSVDTGTVF